MTDVCVPDPLPKGTITVPGLVLAAGFSRRMGRCKLTLPLEGEPLLRRVIRTAVDAGLSPVGVVMRPESMSEPELYAAAAGFGSAVQSVPAPDAHLGQSASLKSGIRWLLERERTENGSDFQEGAPFFSGVVVLLGDQPLVAPELVRTLLAAFREDPRRAVAPEYEGERGNPVILPRAAFDAILQLSGDTGARGLLRAFNLRLVSSNDRAAVTDIDTWEAYQHLQTILNDAPDTTFAGQTAMPQTPPSIHFDTPSLHSGKPYEIPPLPPLWSLWDKGELDTIGRMDAVRIKLSPGTDTAPTEQKSELSDKSSTQPERVIRGPAPIPDEARCRELWEQYAMFEHIQRHSLCVADMATALALRAVEKGFWPDRQEELVTLTRASGLLHDIAKSYTVQYGGSHAQIGASWVIAATGNHRIAQAVFHHVEWPWEFPEDLIHPLFFVLYADKRARHDEVVSLEERYVDLMERYGKTEHSRIAIHRGRGHAITIERVLSAQLGFSLHESTVVDGRLVKRA